MRSLVAVAAVLFAACSKPPDLQAPPASKTPAPRPEPPAPKPPDPIPAPYPEESRAARRELFEVNPKADQSKGHDLIAFVGRAADLEALTEAHLSKDGPKDLRPLRSTDDLNFYMLWGRRIDDLPKRGVHVGPAIKRIMVTATWKFSSFGGMNDTGGIRYVGYGLPLGPLPAGRYAAEVHENTRDPAEGRRRTAQITFEVLPGPAPGEPEPPPKGGQELPRLTCQSGCCVGMHSFNLGFKCRECGKIEIANGHKYCSSCAQKLRRCVHCGEAWK